MKTKTKLIFASGILLGTVATSIFFARANTAVMLVDFGTQKCIHVDGDPSKCSLYSKKDVIVKNSAF